MATKAATTTTTTTSNDSPRDSTDSESPVEETAKAMDAKRLLKRNQQRDFRRKVNQQLEFLRRRVAELEAELEMRKKGRSMLLPWSHVEQALRHDLAECQATNTDLNATVRARVALTHAMTKWLQSIYQPIERGPNELPTWFRAGLCDNDEARRAVCDWITQHMYYHTDSVLQRMGFHPSDQSPMQEFVFDTSKGYIEYIYRDRCIHYASLDRVLEAYRRLCHTSTMPFVAANRQRLDASILGDEFIYSRHHAVNDNLVHREFVSENRVVFVQHSIHDDPSTR
ncbi:hypothetical protein SPRG_03365 [Saprolegnia parasitica CBS 223.65]|uniref:BZIP domain-containing protein n=1 Tax=Saprolegnia parasitica (strain CBS 223.65) TaxID=695850 RepID=A0A067CNS5_SAPPC|nr:hypothetical protein SPRG_03365 [Saprolegnia parasitica CBS 223.65]KDO32148.1 hypothetical protein SPRG_03365 [Saprolegnia parasitica CBS 223.65]|eukprot:XP_012197332.1 hypothetical protein SPRG_03365 [Saprolegnia parasitica CBS 223.65]